MNITDIKTEFGAYYMNTKQGRASLSRLLAWTSETEKLLTRISTTDTKIDRASSTMDRLLQSFQKTWTPIGTLAFTPISIMLSKMKLDYEEYPDELEETWLGFLAGDGLDRTQWPFIKWLLEVHIFPQLEEDWELNEIYGGALAAIVPGTPGAAGTAVDGIKKVINDQITGGRITPIVTGAPSADPVTFVGQVEAFVRSIDKRYWKKPMPIAMSQDLELRFKDGMEIKYNTNYKQESDIAMVKNFPHSIVGVPSMTGANKIWCSPKGNGILGVKRPSAGKTVEIEKIDRKVKIYNDTFKGVGFIVPEIVFTNDQDLV